MPLTFRALTTRTFGLNSGLSVRLNLQQLYTVPEARIDKVLLDTVRGLVTEGVIQLVDAEPSHGLHFTRPALARRQLHIVLGTGNTGSVVLPNGSTLHYLKLGGVQFILGNGNIDAADAAGLLAAFVAAVGASSDFAATGATIAASTLLAGDEKALIVIDGDGVADWSAFVAASNLTDGADGAIGSPALTLTTFTPASADAPLANVAIVASKTAVAADVTRGYIVLDTGLTDLTTNFAVAIRRSGSTILHNGTVSVLNSRVVLIQNDGSTDFANGDVVMVAAFGND